MTSSGCVAGVVVLQKRQLPAAIAAARQACVRVHRERWWRKRPDVAAARLLHVLQRSRGQAQYGHSVGEHHDGHRRGVAPRKKLRRRAAPESRGDGLRRLGAALEAAHRGEAIARRRFGSGPLATMRSARWSSRR